MGTGINNNSDPGEPSLRRPCSKRYGFYIADAQRNDTDSLGIINYSIRLLEAMIPHLRDGELVVVYVNSDIAPELAQMAASDRCLMVQVRPPHNSMERLLIDNVWSRHWAKRDNLISMHYPKGMIPVISPRHTGLIATVHDCIPCHYLAAGWGSLVRRAKWIYFCNMIKHTLRRADIVITDSGASSKQLASFATAHPVVIPLAGSPNPNTFVPLAQRTQVLIHFGSKLPHKRTLTALTWTERYLMERQLPLSVLVIGSVDENLKSIMKRKSIEHMSRTRSEEEITSLIGNCRGVIFTSVLEGFGLPPLEAASLGTPSTWCRCSAMPETMGGLPGGHDAWNYERFAEALDQILSLDDAQLMELQSYVQNRFSWSDAAERVLNRYRSILPR